MYRPAELVYFGQHEFTNLVNRFACQGLMDYDESLFKFPQSNESDFFAQQTQRIRRYQIDKATTVGEVKIFFKKQ